MIYNPSQRGFRLAIAGIMLLFMFVSYFPIKSGYNFSIQEENRNLINIQKIQLGMDTSAVISIMGKPVNRYLSGGGTSFYYPGTASSSLDCHIIFDKNEKVVRYFPTAEELKKLRK